MSRWNEGRPVGLYVYDLDSLTEVFGPARVAEFVEAAHTTNVLEARRVNDARVLTWTTGTPNMTSHQTLHEQWANKPPDERERLEEVLAALGEHQLDHWFLA